jgi:predicted ArsR family transcriptional regulator
MREREFSVKILMRRARLIRILHDRPVTKLGDIALELGVSRWTIWRDMRFLVAHECLALAQDWDRSSFGETFEDLLGRFREAHNKKRHSCTICEELKASRKQRNKAKTISTA